MPEDRNRSYSCSVNVSGALAQACHLPSIDRGLSMSMTIDSFISVRHRAEYVACDPAKIRKRFRLIIGAAITAPNDTAAPRGGARRGGGRGGLGRSPAEPGAG